MSERGGGFGAFVFGIVLGAVAGFLFAPEGGGDTRRRVTKGLGKLKDLAEEKVDEVRGLLEEAEDEDQEAGEEEEPEVATREQLRRRLQAARRRRNRAEGPAARAPEEEDEPLA